MNYNLNPLFPKPAVNNAGTPIAGQRLAVAGAAVQFATAFDINTSLVAVDFQAADMWVTFDNSTPASTNGHRFYVGDKVTWAKATATAAKFIQVSAAGAVQASEFSV